jgi:hypothetical protein
MKNNRCFLPSLIFLLLGVFCITLKAQQKKFTRRTNFSGEWKSKESISMGGNIVCSYDVDDRMNAERIKITEHADFLTIEVPSNTSKGAGLVRNKEKLNFDGTESEINHGQGIEKKFTVKLSADRQTMHINTIVQLMYNVNGQKGTFVYVKEVWQLSNDGKSIMVQANAKSTILGDERNWKTVLYKTN